MSTAVTLRGRLGGDPDLSYSPKGTPVARFSMVTSRNRRDPDTGTWTETGTTWWRVTAFGQLAENCAESLEKGTAVIVVGEAAEEQWETKEGEKRRSMKVTADDVAPGLRWTAAQVKHTGRSKATVGSSQAAEDPWASDQPPF